LRGGSCLRPDTGKQQHHACPLCSVDSSETRRRKDAKNVRSRQTECGVEVAWQGLQCHLQRRDCDMAGMGLACGAGRLHRGARESLVWQLLHEIARRRAQGPSGPELQLAAIKQWSVYTRGRGLADAGSGCHTRQRRATGPRGRAPSTMEDLPGRERRAVGTSEHIAPYHRRRRASSIVLARRCAYHATHTSHPRRTTDTHGTLTKGTSW
jgi:hypothetical protein